MPEKQERKLRKETMFQLIEQVELNRILTNENERLMGIVAMLSEELEARNFKPGESFGRMTESESSISWTGAK